MSEASTRREDTAAATAPRSSPTLRAEEPVVFIDTKHRRRLHFLSPGERFHSAQGFIDNDDVLGKRPGAIVRTSKGAPFAVYRATFEEYVLLMKRAAQIVPPKDIPYIVQWADVPEGGLVVEAGLGSGALCLALLRAVGASGRVIAYEQREDHAARGLKNIRGWPEGLATRLDARIGDVFTELATLHAVDRLVLDLPEPWRALEGAAAALAPGGIVVAYVPTIRQIDQFVLAALDHGGFAEPEVCELLLRPWKADRTRLRPDLKMVGHSGFLARCRRREYVPEDAAATGARDAAADAPHNSAAAPETSPPAFDDTSDAG